MQIKTDSKGRYYLVAAGRRIRVFISKGPWVAGVPADLIKIRPAKMYFPAEIASALIVENNSDSLTDYFESDCIRLMPGSPLYDEAVNA